MEFEWKGGMSKDKMQSSTCEKEIIHDDMSLFLSSLKGDMHNAIFNMDHQQGTTVEGAQGALLNVRRSPG